MAATFHLEIKTPDKLLFSGEVESIIVTHSSGKEGYLANHESVLKPIDGSLQYRQNTSGDFVTMDDCAGWLLFSDNKAVVFLRSN